MFTTTQMAKLGRKGLAKQIKLYQEKERDLVDDVCMRITDKQTYMEILQIGDFGMLGDTNEGTGVNVDTWRAPYSKQYTAIMRTLGFQVTEQAEDADIYRELVAPASKMSLKATATRNQVAFNVFNNATSTATAWAGPDTAALVSTSHSLESGTASNRPSTDVVFGTAGLDQGIQELMLQKTHRGDPAPQMGPFNLYIHPNNRMKAERIIKSRTQAQTPNREDNMYGPVIDKIICSPYLTDTDNWFLRASDDREHGIFFYQKIPLTVKTDYLINYLVYMTVIFEMYVTGNVNWRGTWGSCP